MPPVPAPRRHRYDSHRRPWRRRWPAIAAVALALTLSACGSSGPENTGTGASNSSATQQFVAYSKCMRKHGVTNFPDPSSTGGGLQLQGVDPHSPVFVKAHDSCSHPT